MVNPANAYFNTVFKASIVRIYHANEEVAGAGFLVSSEYVLTCAHVIAAVLNMSEDTLEIPQKDIYFDFPLIASGEKLKAQVDFWKPVSQIEALEDIAALKVESQLPSEAKPVSLKNADNFWKHEFRLFGFPRGRKDGVWATGELLDKTANGWVHIEDIKEAGYQVEHGFSGSPVWDEQLAGVVGMIVASETRRENAKAAFMIPTQILFEAWPDLESKQNGTSTPTTPVFCDRLRQFAIPLTVGTSVITVGGIGAAYKYTQSPEPDGVSTTPFEFEVVTVNDQGQKNRRLDKAEGFKEDLGNEVGLEMVAIPGGWLPKVKEERKENKRKQPSVKIAPIFMSKYPITRIQWRTVALYFPQEKLFLSENLQEIGSENKERPIEYVTWEEAVEFCDRLSKKTGRKYRLPSELEWEYSCRAGTETYFHFGDSIDSSLVNFVDLSRRYDDDPIASSKTHTTKVGGFSPNAFGLYDMHGNVWEWCDDLCQSGDRVMRGGSWHSPSEECRSDHRSCMPQYHKDVTFGFRVVFS
jgi:formylglycine-generating enzyme required for sulfatase activity/S1-C subfamily serine protease